jgi:tetraacyldisaccharide 4'-kinase
VRGIERLTASDPDLDVVLLDDAFQHRYVKPGMNILLVDYHRLIIYDRLLPAGRLREPLKGKNRADIVIVTKCPRELNPMEFRVLTKAMGLFPYQQLYFTTLEYDELQPVFPDAVPHAGTVSLSQLKDSHVLLLTGIASPQQLILDLKNYTTNIHPLSFRDHHDFTPKDAELINSELKAMPQPRYIITTEKDAVRLMQTEGLSQEVRQSLYVLPVRIAFMLGDETKFNENIKGYVLKNSRNSILAKAKDDYKPQDSHRAGNGTRTISFRNY